MINLNILFLTIGFPENINNRNIYTDLMQEFKSKGNNVYVVTARERRYNKDTELSIENDLNVLRVRTGNMQKTNFIEKGITTILIEGQFIKAIKEHFNNVKFDLVMYSTPPITFERVIKYIKGRDNAKSYLLLKDIFPQNAVDLGLLSQSSPIYKYFRKKEITLYKVSDYIGCMSQANVKYVLNHNSFVDKSKVEICPNSIKPLKFQLSVEEKKNIREKYNIPLDSTVFIYGGNLGKPQGIDFLMDVLKENSGRKDVYFLIVGGGTEYGKLETFIKGSDFNNVGLYPSLPKEDYDKVVQASDIGMIFLHKDFTIPNFPSRLLTYMEFSMPVIAATDANTDIGDVLKQGKLGYWCESGNLQEFNKMLDELCKDKNLLREMGENSRRYLEENYTVTKSYGIIKAHF
ncbi:glycosyltransferase family 4 protein [Clostridium sp.]|uniref:glycosyltransferase family 4 protein n=1 Tax=Clostridium sp. TaxID=1506 RepID=UPI002FCA70BA